jgi:uncharacterized protein
MPFELISKSRHNTKPTAPPRFKGCTTEAEAEALIEKYAREIAEADARVDLETRGLPQNLERRPFSLSEMRAESSGSKRILKGYGCKWNTLSSDLGGFREALAPGCFSRCLARPGRDLPFLFDHSTSAILARESAGTFKVEEDSIGLNFRAELANTTMANDVYENVKAGNLGGCSFAMLVRSDAWGECDEDPDSTDCDDDDDNRSRRTKLRTVKTADIYEISVVTMPAYGQTTVSAGARSLFPNGIPPSIPLEVRSRLINAGAAGELTPQEEEDLRTRMKLAALAAAL